MPRHHDDIELTIGDEWFIVGLLLDENDTPLDLMAAGTTLGWTMLGPDGNQVPGLSGAATLEKQAGGIVNITVPDSLTRTLHPARYMDAIRVWVNGSPMTEWTGDINAHADPFHLTVLTAPAETPAVPNIDDAPSDGKTYVRRDGQWIELVLPSPPPPDQVAVDAPQDGEFYARRNGQWVAVPSGFSTIFEYVFDAAVVVPPANSKLRFNNANPALVTRIWLHNNNADGIDVSNLLTLVEAGFIIFVQDKDNPTQRARFQSTGPMTNLGTYCELPVQYITSAGTLTDNQRIIVVVYGGG